jgi:hypothetical protein
LLDDLLRFMARHAAVRSGDRLAPGEIAARLAQSELAQHSRHGRPAFLRFGRHDRNRQLKRV